LLKFCLSLSKGNISFKSRERFNRVFRLPDTRYSTFNLKMDVETRKIRKNGIVHMGNSVAIWE